MLSVKQKEIIIGSLLGDGFIDKNQNRFRFMVSQSKFDHIGYDKKSYIDFYQSQFEDFGINVSESIVKPSGIVLEKGIQKEYYRYIFRVKSLPLWEKIEKQWYVPRTDHPHLKRRKIVPLDIKLTPLSLCIWHMDDGSNNQIDANIELNTQGFTVDEIDFLIFRLKEDLNIKSHKKKCKKEQFKIYIGRESYFDFIEMIKPHVKWDCFKYKIDTSGYDKKPHRGENHSNSKITEDIVREIFRLRDTGMKQKEIAKKIGVSNISIILSGKQWAHLDLKRDNIKKPRVSSEIKKSILDLRSQGVLQKEISQKLNINQSTVSRILKRNVQCHA